MPGPRDTTLLPAPGCDPMSFPLVLNNGPVWSLESPGDSCQGPPWLPTAPGLSLTQAPVCEGGLTKFGPPHHGMGERTPASQRRPPSPPQVLQKAPASVPREDVQDRPAYWCCAVHDTCLRPASRCMLRAYLLPPGEGHCSSHSAWPDRAAGGRVVVLGGSECTWQRLSSPRKWTMACTLENLPQQTHSSAPLNWGRLRPAGRD